MEKSNLGHQVRIQLALRMGGCVLLFSLSGCGNPASEQKPSATSTTTAADSPAAFNQTSARTSVSQAPHEAISAQSIDQSTAKLERSPLAHSPLTVAPRDTESQLANSLPSRSFRDVAERAQWQAWYAEARESPDATIRLRALEQWVQQPGSSLDPLTYALVDGDEDVRARAQHLWEQQLMRAAEVAQPTQSAEKGSPSAQ